MTSTLLVASSLVFLLASFVLRANSDTNWSTESDAEEEEEKKLNILLRNESLRVTPPSEGPSTTSGSFRRGNVVRDDPSLWGRRLNASEYDELHDESKHDASPENSVDKDAALDNVNYFLQENPAAVPPEDKKSSPTESSIKEVEISTEPSIEEVETSTEHSSVVDQDNSTYSKDLLLDDLPSSLSVEPSAHEDVVSEHSIRCASGESSKCKVLPALESMSKTKIIATSTGGGSMPLWNVVKTSKPRTPSVSSSDYPLFDSVSPTQSSSAQTSENTISVDEIENGKDETVIQTLQNKSDKAKPFKLESNVEENDPEEWTTVKSVTPLLNTPLKNLISHSSSHIGTPSLDLYDSSYFSASDSPSTVLSLPSKTVDGISKTNVYHPLVSDDEEAKLAEMPLDFDKMSRSKPTTGFAEVLSVEDSKSSSVVDTEKPSRAPVQLFPRMTTILTPSFREIPLPTSSVEVVSSSYLEPSYSSSFISPVSVSDVLTPVLKSTSTEQSIKGPSTSPYSEYTSSPPPPRLSNPSCSTLPVCVEITLLETTWESFCGQQHEFREFLSRSVSHYTRPVFPHHIVLDAEPCLQSAPRNPQALPDIRVPFFVTNESGEYEERLTEICGIILRKWAPTAFHSSVMEIRLFNSDLQSTPLPMLPEFNSGFVAAVSISAVAGVALCLLCILLVIMKQKMLHARSSDATTPTADAYSLDSLSINASFRRRRNRRSARSYLNHAFNDQEILSHPLSSKTLANCLKSRDLLEDEYKKIPMNMPKLDTIPEGAHVKNRYSNILPRPESRVVLAEPSGDPLKCYINANFVTGYDGKAETYVTCQAPLPEGIEDFWRMVWERQSRVIVMLTMFEENGTSRCAMYFPQSTLVSQQPHGDFQVSLLKKDVYEFYTMSTLRLLDLEKNLFRDVVHLWFTGWPDVGVPKDPSSLMTFVQQCKPYINCNSGPTIVHCSTGTGRTGVFIALDICSREYEESRSLDILQCVSRLRKDRAGAVQNKDQYILIYEAMLEYTTRVANQTHGPQNGSC